MSFFRRRQCGRQARKPGDNGEDADFDEDSLEDQIEFLRAKINIKERYNKAVLEELQANHSGAQQLLKELNAENDDLRYERNEEINKGKTVASKALRRNRLFQLALLGKDALEVLNWLDDKIFDLRKKLDELSYRQSLMRKKLAEAENSVIELEKWPFPGSLPWEQDAIAEFMKIGIAISDEDSLRDSAKILNMRYKCILQHLKDQRATWPYSLLAMQITFDEYTKEMETIEQMLIDAIGLKQSTYYRLVLTKQEYADNRKARKQMMANLKKKIELQLASNHKRFHKAAKVVMMKSQSTASPSYALSGWMSDVSEILVQLKFKQAKLLEYEDRAKVLIDTMRVHDLRFCPKRLEAVAHIHEIMQAEIEGKKQLLTMVLKQNSNLILINSHLMYSGCAKLEQYEKTLQEKEEQEADIKREKNHIYHKINKVGDFAVLFHEFGVGFCDKLMYGKGKVTHELHENYLELGNLMRRKLLELTSSVEELRGQFKEEPTRNYGAYIKMPVTKNSSRLSQLYHKSDADTDSSDDEFASMSSDILSRENIKQQAERIYTEAMARKGYR